MEFTDREKDALQASSGTIKSALSLVPGLAQAIAGLDAYNQSKFERNVQSMITYLNDKVDNLGSICSDEWLETENGKLFSRKVVDSALDAQLEDKQELFFNALINGVRNRDISELEKLKFVDMLRQLSRASLEVLADMHKIYGDQASRPGRKQNTSASPHIDREKIVDKLSDRYNPYLIESCVEELKAVGLFSPNIEYYRLPEGKYRRGNYLSEGNSVYTEFTYRFVEFITVDSPNANLGQKKEMG